MLLVDCGNSRIKWASARAGELADMRSSVHLDRMDAALAELESSVGTGVRRALVANVAGSDLADRLRARLGGRLGLEVEFVRTEADAHGVRVAYDDPATLGVDRWLGMIAARRRWPDAAVCVVSAGTAVTIDLVTAEGRHRGGLILVGPRLAAEALESGTRGIGPTPLAERAPDGLDLFARNTGGAVGQGSLLAIAAAVDRAAKISASELGVTPVVVLTGGEAERIVSWLESAVHRRPDLVLEGLLSVGASLGGQDA